MSISSHTTRIVGISGGTCSGKTSVAKELGYPVLSQDMFYKGLEPEEDMNISDVNWDHPNRINFRGYLDVLRRLKRGESPEVPIYDYVKHKPASTGRTLVNTCGTIVVEGIFVGLTAEERELFDMLVFVDVPDDERLIRRLRRGRGIRSFEETLTQWERFVKPGHTQFIEPIKVHANIIIPKGVENLVAMNLIKDWLESYPKGKL